MGRGNLVQSIHINDIKKARPNKSSLNTRGTSQGYYDAFRRKIIPSDARLVQEYKRTIYTCSNLNANTVVGTPLRLYLKTSSGDSKSFLSTKAVPDRKIEYLEQLPYLKKTLRSYMNVEEVVEHPLLTLLEKANTSRHFNGQRMMELIQLYQELTGQAYLLVEASLLGVPKNLWILPSQYVEPVKEFNNKSNKIIDYYEFKPPGHTTPFKYRVEDVISFLMPSVENPYVDGMSPLEAAFESNEVNKKLLSHEDALLTNEGRPDLILSPKDTESAFSADTAERFEREYRMKFTYGRTGGVWVPDEPVTMTPVTLPPRDLARLEINKWSKNDIANAFSIPFALIADASHNRQQLDAATFMHAKYGIVPRCNRNACTWNDLLVPLYDDTGRLFLAYDDAIPENREEKMQQHVQFVMNGIETPNEARKEYGMAPIEGGDELRAINVSPEMMRENRSGRGDDERES